VEHLGRLNGVSRTVKGVLFAGALLAAGSDVAIALAPPAQTIESGPYYITLNQTTVVANETGVVTLTVRKYGNLATDLLPYGGASGVAELVDTRTGASIHTTLNPLGTAESTSVPTGIKPTSAGAEMELSLPPLPADAYRLRVGIRGAGGKIYTASFTLLAFDRS
jgi:hypothetical protein